MIGQQCSKAMTCGKLNILNCGEFFEEFCKLLMFSLLVLFDK